MSLKQPADGCLCSQPPAWAGTQVAKSAPATPERPDEPNSSQEKETTAAPGSGSNAEAAPTVSLPLAPLPVPAIPDGQGFSSKTFLEQVTPRLQLRPCTSSRVVACPPPQKPKSFEEHDQELAEMMKLPPAESSKGTEKEPAQTTEDAKVKEDAVPQKTEDEKVTEGKVPQAKPDMAAADAKPPKDESNDSEAEGFDPFEVAEKHEAEQQQRKQQPEMPAKASETAEASKPVETIEERRPVALPQVQKADAVTAASNARPQPVRKLALRNHRAVLMRVWCRCNSAADSSV